MNWDPQLRKSREHPKKAAQQQLTRSLAIRDLPRLAACGMQRAGCPSMDAECLSYSQEEGLDSVRRGDAQLLGYRQENCKSKASPDTLDPVSTLQNGLQV